MYLGASPANALPPNTGTPQIPSWLTSVGAALQIYNQQRLSNINLSRARQGLAPIEAQSVPGLVPTVQVGVDPATRNTGLLVAASIGGAIVLALLMRRRR